jgi:coenzyme PQQ precursor peptide PqqA
MVVFGLAPTSACSYLCYSRINRVRIWEDDMAWNTPKIVEVAVGMEINMYACAARK